MDDSKNRLEQNFDDEGKPLDNDGFVELLRTLSGKTSPDPSQPMFGPELLAHMAAAGIIPANASDARIVANYEQFVAVQVTLPLSPLQIGRLAHLLELARFERMRQENERMAARAGRGAWPPPSSEVKEGPAGTSQVVNVEAQS